jgi:hypothetical protein
MVTARWCWIIVTVRGYYTGSDPVFSNLIKDIRDPGYFTTEAEAIAFARDTLSLTGDDVEFCRVVYRDRNPETNKGNLQNG